MFTRNWISLDTITTRTFLIAVKLQGQFMEMQGHNQLEDQEMCLNESKEKQVMPDVGRKLVFDNIDCKQEMHHMTEEHQNMDVHSVTYMSVANRVSGHHFCDAKPTESPQSR